MLRLAAHSPPALGSVLSAPCYLVRNIPVLKTLVAKYGCSDLGRRAATLALQTYNTSQLGPMGSLVGSIGAAMAIDCACGSTVVAPVIAPPPPVSIWKSPWLIGGMVVLGIGLMLHLAKPSSVEKQNASH